MTDITPEPEPIATAPTATTVEAPEEKEPMNWIELVAALLLGVAGILTAYAAYNGALAGGDALSAYTESARMTSDANSLYSDYGQTYSADVNLYTQWEILVQRGELDAAAAVSQKIMSFELENATNAWEAMEDGPEKPLNPLSMPEYTELDPVCYASDDCISAAKQLQQYSEGFEAAAAKFSEAQKIDDQGDNFDLASVYFAVALFFAGIAALFKVRSIQIAMLLGAALLLAPGIQAVGVGKGWW